VARKAAQELDKWEWLDLLASEHGPKDPSTRLVLFVLSLHMTQRGERCFPSQKLIATRSALSERAVRDHLNRAQAARWIGIYRKRREGQAWYVNEYVALIPTELAHLVKEKPWEADPGWQRPAESAASPSPNDRQDLPPVEQRPANGAGRPANNVERPANGAATTGNLRTDDRQNLPTNSSSELPNELPNEHTKERAAHACVFEKVKTAEEIEAEERAREESEKRAAEAAKVKALADKAAAEEQQRQRAVARANRIKVALKAFPDYGDEDIRKVAGGETLAEVEQLRRQA
jgi:hypothetical protein